MTSDPAIWSAARQKLPLPMLMTVMGDGAHTKRGSECPFCNEKDKGWSLVEKGGKHFFKCFNPVCVANQNDVGHNEIAYIQLRMGLNQRDAAKHYLKLAVPDLVQHLFEPVKPTRPKAASNEFGAEDPEPEPEPDDDDIPGIAPQRPPPPPPPRDGDAKNPWHGLWKKLPLTVADRRKLNVERGLSDEIIDALGFRSNNTSNLHHLQTLATEFSLDRLIEEGIYKEDGRGARPSGQFQGWGITDKKDSDGHSKFEQTEPIIIPYLDDRGVPFYLRPHKGGVKKPKDELEEIELFEDEHPSSCAAHVYCPFLLVELIHLNDGLVVLTEGEFKAAALMQCGIAAIACPGIQFVRNQAFKEELIHLLRTFGVTDMVIIFDNEVKDDPAFPKRYKADPWKRWDTPMWAEYTAIDLRDYFATRGSCRIGWLPDEYRVNGKADCDGILAQMVFKHGDKEGTRMARRIFLDTIERASEKPSVELFPSESRRIIECKLQRLFYKPLILAGGNRELTLSRRFSEYDTSASPPQPIDKFLSDLYRSLKGCYYERQTVKEKEVEPLSKEITELNDKITSLKGATSDQPEWERKRKQDLRILYARLAVAWEKRKGIPKILSNFTLSCEYKLHPASGEVVRLVTMRDSKERARPKTPPLRRVTPGDLARLGDFRKWCYATGEGVFHGGDKNLQALVQDMDHHSYLRDIHEVTTYGYHPHSKIWFFGDVAFDAEGKPIHPDSSNIFWHDGIGYQIDSSVSERGEHFAQGAPLLLSPQGPVPALETPNTVNIFRQFSEDLYNTVGGFEGWLIMGLTAAYAIGPELIRAGGHPSLWLSGKMSGGKTTVARWIMRCWGFKELGGIRIGDSSTPTAMNRFLAQYHSLPVWMDEYRRLQVDAQREEVLRGAFDRSSGAKGIADHSNRTRNATILTTPIVCGESSSGDSATRSRYGHVSVSVHNRIGDGQARYGRVQNDANHFYHLGYWLMRHRKAFAEAAMKELETWMSSPKCKAAIINERTRLVHGVAFACFKAMASIMGLSQSIEVPEPGDADENPDGTSTYLANSRLQDYEAFLLKHGEQALSDVMEETFLNHFWRDIISGLQLGKIPKGLVVERYVQMEADGRLSKINANDPGAAHVLYFAPEALFASYQQYKAGRREDAPQQLSDIRRELEKEPYWVPFPRSKECRVHRIAIRGHKTACWVLTLERGPAKTKGQPGPYVFPFAEDLIDAITRDPDSTDDLEPQHASDES